MRIGKSTVARIVDRSTRRRPRPSPFGVGVVFGWPLLLILGLILLPSVALAVQPDPILDSSTAPTAIPSGPGSDASTGSGWVRWFHLASLLAVPLVVAVLWAGNIIRPGSLSRRLPPPAAVHHWAALLIGAALVYLIGGVGASIAAAYALPWPRVVATETNAGRGVVILGQYGLAVPAALAMLALTSRALAAHFKPRDLGLGLLGLLLAYPIIAVLAQASSHLVSLVQGEPPDPIAHETLERIVQSPDDAWVRVMMLGAVLAAPVVEEVVYRHLLQSALIQIVGRAWLGVLIAAIIFAAAHATVVPWHTLPVLAVLGASFGILYLKTGRLGPAIVAHVGFNALNVALTLYA
jgi:membrane protease YdiL (CAAX protease family)